MRKSCLCQITTAAFAFSVLGSSIVAAQEDAAMEERCRREVVELHRFFQDWFNAELPDDAASFARLEEALAEDFEIIGPDGHLVARSAVLPALRGGHGRNSDHTFAIEVRNLSSRTVAEGMVLVTYEEHQTMDGEVRNWLSSALFRAREGRSNGVEWIHVQETYLPKPEDD